MTILLPLYSAIHTQLLLVSYQMNDIVEALTNTPFGFSSLFVPFEAELIATVRVHVHGVSNCFQTNLSLSLV